MKKRILTVGEARIDLCMPISELPRSPKAPVIAKSCSFVPSGSGAIAATAVARLGGDSVLCTRIGRDRNGTDLRKIYEYEKGFVHAKCYLIDDEIGMVGTINMDYRSLVHHFENGVWMYKTNCLSEIKADMLDTMEQSIFIKPENVKVNLLKKFIRSIVRIFAPLL